MLSSGNYTVTNYAYDAATHTLYATNPAHFKASATSPTVNMTFADAPNLTVNEAGIKLSSGTSWIIYLSTG